MSNRFIKSVLSVAALVTALSTLPARAVEPDQIGRIVGTAVGLAVLGRVLNEMQDGGDGAAVTWSGHRERDRRQRDRHHRWGDRPGPRGHAQPAPLPHRCIFPIVRNSSRFAVGPQCLRQIYRDVRRLPGGCIDRVHLRGGVGTVRAYKLACLRSRGYTVAGRDRGW